jgi:tRNA(fMet)-specific endonuclease VapC
MKTILIDTNVIIYHLRGKYIFPEHLINSDLKISAITHGEILFGINYSHRKASDLNQYNKILQVFDFEILDIDKNIIEAYSNIKYSLKSKGQSIEDFDILIAATAIAYRLPLFTYNIKHFKRIPNLILYQISNGQ